MSPDSIFSLCSTIAMAGWIILVFMPFWFHSDKFILGIIVALLAIVYAWLLFDSFHFADIKKFGSLAGVMELFGNPVVITAGWVHYLAFDLVVGIFIKRNGVKHNISHWLLVPCYLLTFMFGPVGLLLYLLIRFIVTRQYFASNF
jgi:hypothetical protein